MCYEKEKGEIISVEMQNVNALISNINDNLPTRNKMVYIMANPYRYSLNDSLFEVTRQSFQMSDIVFNEYKLIDYRYTGDLWKELRWTDLIILGGGDCEPQLAFFKILGLKGLLGSYKGLIIGRSAGTMGMATEVYCCPEFEQHKYDRKFAEGLGLTNIMTLPHYSRYKDKQLWGRKLIEDIVFNDIKDKTLYVLDDGSYILIKDGKSVVFGLAYIITNKTISKICENGETYVIK